MKNYDDFMYIAINTEEIAFAESMIIGQAMNLVPPLFLHHRSRYITNIVNQYTGKALDVSVIATKMESLLLSNGPHIPKLGEPQRDILWDATFKTGTPHLVFLAPPVTTCYNCDGYLQTHNSPTNVLCFGMEGPFPALKITLRCRNCGLNYRYIIIM